ncbi:MAG: hypothetical protein JXM74_01760 [Fusobacteriaceae bacterium]|nr:hypothetical protein [Fusobacteriaceae bacterium]
MKKLAVMITAFAMTFLTGCASIVRGSSQSVTINASQSDSKIVIKDTLSGMIIAEGKERLTVDLKRGQGYFEKGNYTIEVSKKGYETVSIPLVGKTDAKAYGVGNLFSWGIIGWVIVDPMTGAMWTLSTPAGQDGKKVPIHIILRENATGEMMDKATKMN